MTQVLPAELLEAVKTDDARRVAELVAQRPELARAAGACGKTGLHWAAEKDAIGSAHALLDAGADIEARTSWGATAFEWAATMGSSRVADLLLSRGASGLNVITAAALGKLVEVQDFIESGADLSPHLSKPARVPDVEWPADTAFMRGDVLSAALHAAARNGQVEVVEYLLARGALVDAKGFFGAPGLHWAAVNGHAAMVEVLISRGADPGIRDARFGGTAAEWAMEGGHPGIAKRIRRGR